MLTLQDIPRVKAGTTVTNTGRKLDEMDQERLTLATRAKDLLGYHKLAEHVTGVRKVTDEDGKLTATLLKLDIDVLDTMSVINYQLEEAIRRDKEFILDHMLDYAGSGYRFYPAKWEKTELSSYEQPIPEFVLDKAVKIREALPEVKFNIQHLADPKADPFLVAFLDKELYYIEAWAEPRFERTL